MDFWTGSCRQTLVNAGWRCVEYDGITSDIPFGAVILWERDRHVCVCSISGLKVLDCSNDYDGVQGDSSGREISEKNIYGEWTGASGTVYRADYVLIPPYSQDEIGAGIAYGREIANDDRWGYSQEKRWQEFYRDCSSFCADIINHMSASSGGSETPSEKPLQSLTDVANRVILGEYGNMPDRKTRLEAEGWNYEQVRAEVNRLLGNEPEHADEPVEQTADIDEIAQQVIRGEWGNGQERKDRLHLAGYDYDAIQERVNELC